MKTKTFLLLCLLLVIGLTQLSAQSVNFTVEWTGYVQPVICDDGTTDYLTGTVYVYVTLHYNKGTLIWQNYHTSGSVTSTVTGEIFKVKENDFKTDLELFPGFITYHCNLLGDQGSHYIATVTVHPESGGDVYTFDRIICLKNDRK